MVCSHGVGVRGLCEAVSRGDAHDVAPHRVLGLGREPIRGHEDARCHVPAGVVYGGRGRHSEGIQ
jgi:hypothetical protein